MKCQVIGCSIKWGGKIHPVGTIVDIPEDQISDVARQFLSPLAEDLEFFNPPQTTNTTQEEAGPSAPPPPPVGTDMAPEVPPAVKPFGNLKKGTKSEKSKKGRK